MARFPDPKSAMPTSASNQLRSEGDPGTQSGDVSSRPERRRATDRRRAGIPASLLAALSLALGILVAARPSSGRPIATECPNMTDSIARLYTAYFDRDPDSDGVRQWIDSYRSGQSSLEDVSEAFASSAEFESELEAEPLGTDADFTAWAYQRVVGRQPTESERSSWERALDTGYRRGAMMLTLTESVDYVQATATAVPLAGYLRWYPQGTHWYCGSGTQRVSTLPLEGSLHADLYFTNTGESSDRIRLWTAAAIGHRDVEMYDMTLDPGATVYDWGGTFSGSGSYGNYIDVEAQGTTEWIVVFYPESIGAGRFGWQLAPPTVPAN